MIFCCIGSNGKRDLTPFLLRATGVSRVTLDEVKPAAKEPAIAFS
jgi:hypothetical protein